MSIYEDIDYTAYASSAGLTINQIIYLLMGSDPKCANDRCPNFPDVSTWEITIQELDSEYARLKQTLKSAVDVSALSPIKADLFCPKDVISYLLKISQSKGWSDHLDNNPFINAVIIDKPSNLESLIEENSALTAEIKKLNDEKTHKTNMLYWLNEAIREFYPSGHDDYTTKKKIVDWLFRRSHEEKKPLSHTQCEQISAVIIPDKQRKGGRPKTDL